MTGDPHITIRHAARVVVVDPDDRLLLVQVRLDHWSPRLLWITPGGGLEPGESHLQGARRELWEETGIDAPDLHPIWLRDFRFVLHGANYEQREQYFFCRVPTSDAAFTQLEPVEAEQVLALRWWSLPDIRAATDEVFVPRRLAHHAAPLLRGDLPAQPIRIGL